MFGRIKGKSTNAIGHAKGMKGTKTILIDSCVRYTPIKRKYDDKLPLLKSGKYYFMLSVCVGTPKSKKLKCELVRV